MTSEHTSPETLIRRVSRGDQLALGLLYDALAPRLYASVRTRVEESAAIDVTRGVFLDVWRRATQFDPKRQRAVDWAAGIADEWVASRAEASTSAVA